MIDVLVLMRLTALPALVFLLVLPVFLALPARHARAVLIVASAAAICVVAGPVLGGMLLAANVAGYFLVELLARLPARRTVGVVVGVVVLHAGYWACFALPVPYPFAMEGGGLGAATSFILMSGIGLTFFRLITYFKARLYDPVPPLSLADYLLFMLYFPQFRHGPIERAYTFVLRLRVARERWTPQQLWVGLGRISAGLAVLVVGRSVLAIWDHYLPEELEGDLRVLFSDPGRFADVQIIMLVQLPAVALYFLESAYAHLQLGVSRAFGVIGSENFNHPYLATNPRAFWYRWNITLFHWLRDYVYKPLRGRRGAKYRRLPAVVLTFVYCGLLHAPQWSCVVWGAWMGIGVAAYVVFEQASGRRGRAARVAPGANGALPERGAARIGRPPGGFGRLLGRIAARLLVYQWFCIGVTIILDAEQYGLPVLRRWLAIVTGGLVDV